MGAFQKVTIILVHRNVYGGHGAFKLLKPFSGRAELGGAAYDAYFCMTVSYQLHGHLVSADAEVCIGKIPTNPDDQSDGVSGQLGIFWLKLTISSLLPPQLFRTSPSILRSESIIKIIAFISLLIK